MTSLSDMLTMLGLQPASAISKLYFYTGDKSYYFERAKLRCEVCDLWIVYKDYSEYRQPLDLWIVTSLPKKFDRGILNDKSLFCSVLDDAPRMMLRYQEWAQHGLDQAVMMELFK
jgi:hypothetical protein